MSGMRSDPRIPFFSVQIELRRFHWPIAAGVRRTRLLAVGIIISNGFEPCIRCTGNATVTHIDSILAQMFEKRHQLLFEKRQPMFPSGQQSSVADRMIERVAGGGRAAAFPIAASETHDSFLFTKGLR